MRATGKPPKNEFCRVLGEVLFGCRTEAGIRQADIAARSGLSQSFYCDVENGVRGLSVESLLRIADALGVSATKILKEITNERVS